MIKASIHRFVNRVFAERQIYHRRNGTVRYFGLSPGQQIGLVVAALIFAAWLVFTSASVAIGSKSISSTIVRHKISALEHGLEVAQAKEARAVTQLTQRTAVFHDTINALQLRHDTMTTLIAGLQDGGGQYASALTGNAAPLLVTASIGEAEGRQSQRLGAMTAPATQTGPQQQLSEIRQEQNIFLDGIEDMIADRAEKARGVLRLTEVGTELETSGGNMGGPEIDLTALLAPGAFANPEDAEFALRAARIIARMEETHYLEEKIGQLPLAVPVAIPSRMTSPFGMRKDPISQRLGWHAGIDIAAGWNAPIVAAGPGKVIFAGRRPGYGLVVDVDHGQGFVSRYAHLKKITTKKGKNVAIGDRLGVMGSTGRSTGKHLHYEVRFNGKPYNPAAFIKAGKYVHKTK